MTLLELHYILQVFCVCQKDGGGVSECRGSDIVKVESSGEDLMAIASLVSNLPHPRINKPKQHYKRSSPKSIVTVDFLS